MLIAGDQGRVATAVVRVKTERWTRYAVMGRRVLGLETALLQVFCGSLRKKKDVISVRRCIEDEMILILNMLAHKFPFRCFGCGCQSCLLV